MVTYKKRYRNSKPRGGDGTIQGKKIQTLFLEIEENPPQLPHMTLEKENATLLLMPTIITALRSVGGRNIPCPQSVERGHAGTLLVQSNMLLRWAKCDCDINSTPSFL